MTEGVPDAAKTNPEMGADYSRLIVARSGHRRYRPAGPADNTAFTAGRVLLCPQLATPLQLAPGSSDLRLLYQQLY